MTTQDKILKLAFENENNSVKVHYNKGVEDAAHVAREADIILRLLHQELLDQVGKSNDSTIEVLETYEKWRDDE